MDPKARKAAIAAYKEIKTPAGVFAVRCAVDDQVWVMESRHLNTHQTSLWFSLRMGSYPDRTLQGAWKTHGEAAFSFDELERLPEDIAPSMVRTELKILSQAWKDRLAVQT
jgi:hypothetical protein